MTTKIKLEAVTNTNISLWTENWSCALLDRWCINLFDDLDIELIEPVFWFTKLKAKRERRGEGSALMGRLVQILDENRITVINGLNPYGSMNMETLKKFHRKYGFVDIQENEMIRHPVY